MMDPNILNRGSFTDAEIPVEITVYPSKTQTVSHEFGNDTVLLLKEAAWKYSVAAGQKDDYGWPRQGLQVAITNAFKAQVANPVTLNPASVLRNKCEIIIANPSSLIVTVHMILRGVLVKQIPGEPPLSDKEMIGYSLLDNSQKGMLALSEAMIDRLDDHLKQLGLDGLRGRLPGGQVADITMLNSKQFSALPNNDASYHALSSNEVLDCETLKSLLIGEIATCTSTESLNISLEAINTLATFLLAKGWKK